MASTVHVTDRTVPIPTAAAGATASPDSNSAPGYWLSFDHLDGDRSIRPLPVSGAGPAELAQAVHRHARGRLGVRSVDVHLDSRTLTGTVLRANTSVGVFRLEAEDVFPAAGNPVEQGSLFLHGYTLHDLHHLARHAVHTDRWHRAGDIEDRFDAAWHAIVEQLLTAKEPPTRNDLLWAGRQGCDDEVRQQQRAHGYNHHLPGTGTRPRFESYWFTASAHTHSPENGVVERHALRQIWPRLTPRQRQALTALAACGDYQLAAAHLGVTEGTFQVLISRARRRFLQLWHEGERPSRMWGTDRRVGSRTAGVPAATKRRAATRAVVRRTGRPVRELVHGRASTYTNHECRCGPCTQAATDAAREKGRRNGAKPRRRVTVSQLADIRARHENGETIKAIAADVGFSPNHLSGLLSGRRKPAPDPS
jgi:DNA-directed RNA polymerase specialized sigma24 family protein